MSTGLQPHPSYWNATAPHLRQCPLTHDTHADVCVIGAGIAGLRTALRTAYFLVSTGKSVIVLDDGCIAVGPTIRCTDAEIERVVDGAALARRGSRPKRSLATGLTALRGALSLLRYVSGPE